MSYVASQNRRNQNASSELNKNAVVSKHSTGTAHESDEQLFKALWDAIGNYTKEALTFVMGLIVMATIQGHSNERDEALAIAEIILYRAAATQVFVVIPFMARLREASISTLNDLKALAENELQELALAQDKGQGSDAMSISSFSNLASDTTGEDIKMESNANSADRSEES